MRFTLRTPVPFFREVLAVPTASIVNPKVLAQANGADLGSRWLSTHTAGSGPYRVSRFEKGQHVVADPGHRPEQPLKLLRGGRVERQPHEVPVDHLHQRPAWQRAQQIDDALMKQMAG